MHRHGFDAVQTPPITQHLLDCCRKMLMSTKAYVKYHSPPPVASQAKTKLLAAPKPSLTHPETLLARRLEDPTEYAKVKARQLAAKRVITERVEAAKAQEKTQQAHQIKAYQQHKELVSVELGCKHKESLAMHCIRGMVCYVFLAIG